MDESNVGRVRILSPHAAPDGDVGSLPSRLAGLGDRTIGFRVEWSNFEIFADAIEKYLHDVDDSVITKRWDLVMDKRVLGRASDSDKERRQQEFDDFAFGLDAAVVGLAA
jgi:hypothetical protein